MKLSSSNFVFFFLCLGVFLINGCSPTTHDTAKNELVLAPEQAPAEKKVEQQVAFQPEQNPAEKMVEQDLAEKVVSVETDLTIIGEIEPITFVSAKVTMPARIDTGATTSSLDAQDISKYERDGKPWVRFSIKERKTKKTFQLESPLVRTAEIKQHEGDPQMRPVVRLKIKLGATTLTSEFSLTDRSLFKFPVLIGRNVLEGNFVVDVSKKNSTALIEEEPEHEN